MDDDESRAGAPRGMLAELKDLALSPAMSVWGSSVDRALRHIPRPSGPARAYASGRDSLRALIFGAGPAIGWGVTSHDLALPGAFARALSASTGRGADVDLAADPDLCISSALQSMLSMQLWRYDVIVMVLGVNDATRLTSLDTWKQKLDELVAGVEEATSSGTKVVVTGIHPIRSIPTFDSVLGTVADQHATAMNEITEQACARSQRATFAPLTSITAVNTKRHREPAAYTHWADEIVRVIPAGPNDVLRVPRDPHRPSAVDEPAHEANRQRALDRMALDARPNVRLDRVVSIAQRALGTASALFTVIDGDRQWHKARSGVDMTEIARKDAFCDFTIRTREGMVVCDAREDPRFRDKPYVTGEPFIRFYAGYPIESPTGERIGALCVFDSKPREESDVDMVYLRELARLAQRELERDDDELSVDGR
ncbi:GAF domain-containing protein [Marisediminicola sp. UYEF4]|uniref:GDSL-type esterase/lipase family protein n=1 Tax=Marisediminicola sp. UYEF4 TaxID=1756384 RepID=UPI00339578C4